MLRLCILILGGAAYETYGNMRQMITRLEGCESRQQLEEEIPYLKFSAGLSP